MAPSKLRQAVGAAKDQTTIALVRASAADEVASDVEASIVRAMAHGEDAPADERHAAEILTLTRYSRARVASVSRRLGRARTWPVAVKALALVHRLLAEGDPAYEQEVFLTTRRGRRMLDVSRFRERERARSRDCDFAAFVHAYAAYLNDRLNHRMQARGAGAGAASPGKWHVDGDTDGTMYEVAEAAWEVVPGERPATETTTTEDVIAKAQQLKHLLGRFIECRPTGKARMNPVVTAALYRLVKESAVQAHGGDGRARGPLRRAGYSRLRARPLHLHQPRKAGRRARRLLLVVQGHRRVPPVGHPRGTARPAEESGPHGRVHPR